MIRIPSFDLQRRRRGMTLCAVALSGALMVAGCGGGGGNSADGDARFEKAARQTTTTAAAGGTGTGSEPATSGEPSKGGGSPATTAVPAAQPPGPSLQAAVAAFRAALGPAGPIRALQYTQHFPVGDASYAMLQSQDPAVPANVDERDWRDNRVGSPQPVKLSGQGTLEENLFSMDEVNWDAAAANLAGAQALVEQKKGGPLDGSTGVTHIIVEKDLPFSANTVVRVYVDGGPRADGGYVQYLADGSLDKVQA